MARWIEIAEMSVFEKILALLEKHNIPYKLTEHEPVRTSQEAARIRGAALKTGAKPTGCATSCTSQVKWLPMVLHGINDFGTKWNWRRMSASLVGRAGGCWKQTRILCPPDPRERERLLYSNSGCVGQFLPG
jgi:hypothetical protein